jgi:DNA-binding LytR/AlgR family response regulator
MMTRYLVVLRSDRGKAAAKVIHVTASEQWRIAAMEAKKGGTIIGDYSSEDIAKRAAELAEKGWRPPFAAQKAS